MYAVVNSRESALAPIPVARNTASDANSAGADPPVACWAELGSKLTALPPPAAGRHNKCHTQCGRDRNDWFHDCLLFMTYGGLRKNLY